MKLIRLAFWVVVCIGTPSCSGDSTFNKNNLSKTDREIIYKQKDGKNVDVFNVTEGYLSLEGEGYLKRRDFQYGEFGSHFKDCSNKDYFCMKNGLSLAIPKNIEAQKKWKFNDIDCQLDPSATRQQSYAIECIFEDYTINFQYSLERGITSYTQSTNPSVEFELVSEKGFFAFCEHRLSIC